MSIDHFNSEIDCLGTAMHVKTCVVRHICNAVNGRELVFLL